MHKKYGSKLWGSLFKPAEKMAENGFIVSERLASAIANDKVRLSGSPGGSRIIGYVASTLIAHLD